MIRVLELLVSLLIVAALIIVIGVLLPSHGRVERSVEVSSPVRQIYDSINTLRRFPEWAAERRLDPQMKIEFEGPREGVDAAVRWNGNELVGKGGLRIVSSDLDSQVKMAVEDNFSGTNKSYTIRIEPSQNAKTSRIFWSYDVDYGWNLMWRYAGLYIHGAPDANVQASLSNLAGMLASFPNVDYKNQEIRVVDVTGGPMLLVSTKAPRTLDEVAMATDEAAAKIEAFMKKAGLTAVGPRRTITTNWGDENYVFDVAVPVNSASFVVDRMTYTISAPSDSTTSGDDLEGDDSDAPKALAPGDIDGNGNLVLEGEVRGTISYTGKALVTEYAGSAAILPLLRLMEKAWAETHGYEYSEMDNGRFWDETVAPPVDGSTPDAAADGEETWRVYLPVGE